MNSIPIQKSIVLAWDVVQGWRKETHTQYSKDTNKVKASCYLYPTPARFGVWIRGRVNLHVWPMVANSKKPSQSSSNDNQIYRVIALSPEEGLQGWLNLVAPAPFPCNPLFSALSWCQLRLQRRWRWLQRSGLLSKRAKGWGKIWCF